MGYVGFPASKLPPREDPYPTPTPIILDSRLRLPVDCKLIKRYAEGVGRQPWAVCGPAVDAGKRTRLENAGVKIIEVAIDTTTGTHWPPTETKKSPSHLLQRPTRFVRHVTKAEESRHTVPHGRRRPRSYLGFSS